MAHENRILHASLFVGLVCVLTGGADAAVRIGNNTKNDAYRQMVAANMAANCSPAAWTAYSTLQPSSARVSIIAST